MGDVIARNGSDGAATERLRGWKQIARWCGVDERTVKRWETARGLPVRRIAGQPRSPVYAYVVDLERWIGSQPVDAEERSNAGVPAQAAVTPVPTDVAITPSPRRTSPRVRPTLRATTIAVGGVILALVAWRGWELAEARREQAAERAETVRNLAYVRLAEISERLERHPRTLRLRTALAEEAAVALDRVASARDSPPALRRDAAEAYRRLAALQFSTDRPSLGDRAAARASLATGLSLVASDATADGRSVRSLLLIDAARHAAADGRADEGARQLEAALGGAADPAAWPSAARDEWRLAASEVAQWRGDYSDAIAAARPVALATPAQDEEAALRRLRALDLVSEARFYAGDKAGALVGYRQAVALAGAGLARRPDDIRWVWALGRQRWNLGSTLADMGRGAEAAPILADALRQWTALSRADPEDEALARWVRTTRMSYGGALMAAGRADEAAAVQQVAVGEARASLALRPEDYTLRRGMTTSLAALGDALAASGRRDQACAAYAEASDLVRRMDAAGTLTPLDRDSMVKLLRAGAEGACPTLNVPA